MQPVSAESLDQLFRTARSHNGWSDQPVEEATIRQIYDLARLPPTSANSNPGRFVWVRSAEGKARLADCAMGSNPDKIRAAPVTVIVARDPAFANNMPRLFPHAPHMEAMFRNPAIGGPTALRNTTLQGAYLILAARALGLDCGPMSGFDPAKVTEAFLADEGLEPDFLCSIGYGNGEGLFERLPRLEFAEANRLA